jgi:hypothetical protein
VIAGNIDDAGALSRLAEELLHDVIAALRPVPVALQAPAVDDIADQKKRISFMITQEIEEKIGSGGLGTQMHVRNEKRSEMPCIHLTGHEVVLSLPPLVISKTRLVFQDDDKTWKSRS